MSLRLIGGCAPKPLPPIGFAASKLTAQYIHKLTVMLVYVISDFTHHFRSVFVGFHTSEWPSIVILC